MSRNILVDAESTSSLGRIRSSFLTFPVERISWDYQQNGQKKLGQENEEESVE